MKNSRDIESGCECSCSTINRINYSATNPQRPVKIHVDFKIFTWWEIYCLDCDARILNNICDRKCRNSLRHRCWGNRGLTFDRLSNTMREGRNRKSNKYGNYCQ